MRWMLACLLVLAATASARVIRLPPMVEQCGHAHTSDEVITCARTFGDAKVVRTLPHAQLIRIPKRDQSPAAPGFYLFLEDKDHWALAGMREGDGDLFGFDLAKLGTHTAYHFEIGMSEHTEISLDGIKTTPVIYTRREQVYCGNAGYRCTVVMTACDTLVAGKAIETFRGKVEWKADQLHVTGDRSHAGESCEQAEDVPVYFAQ